METKSFIKLLRKIIREEVQLSVRKELRTFLKEQKSPDHKKVINHGLNLHEMVENPRKKKTFTKNNMLNELLNETANTTDFSSMNQGPIVSQTESYPTMNNKIYDTNTIEPQTLATTDTRGMPVDMNNEKVATTVKAMTKDYSALMTAIDKKKGIK